MEIFSSFNTLQTPSLSWLTERKTKASVGLKPSALLSDNASFISLADFPLIDFAFILCFFLRKDGKAEINLQNTLMT